MARRCGNCIHKNVCELYDIVQDPTHAVGCGNFLDSADVVPKSEVDNWYQLYHAIKEELKQEKMYHRATEMLCDRYCIESQHAKRQVAKEIFEEIEKWLGDYNGCRIITYEKYAELKKKYTEESLK